MPKLILFTLEVNSEKPKWRMLLTKNGSLYRINFSAPFEDFALNNLVWKPQVMVNNYFAVFDKLRNVRRQGLSAFIIPKLHTYFCDDAECRNYSNLYSCGLVTLINGLNNLNRLCRKWVDQRYQYGINHSEYSCSYLWGGRRGLL